MEETIQKNKTKIIHWTLLILILAAAFCLRIYKIDSIPAGIYPDEAVNGTDAQLANDTGSYQWFYTNNNGREGLFMNLLSVSIRIFGNTVLGLKIWSILFGTLTVLGVFLLTKELFKGSWRAGLLASYLTAFSYWGINFSRISFRANMLPFVLVFSFYFFFRGLRTKKLLDFALAGLIFGLGLHGYVAFRLAPAIFIVIFIALLMTKENLFREYWKAMIVLIISIFITASPMLYDFYQHPEHFSSRSSSISIFSPEINKGHLPTLFAKTLGLSLVKYTFFGDQNWRHNYPPYPILHPAIGISFFIGIMYLITKTVQLLFLRFRDKVRDEKLYIYIFLLGWFFVMLSPEFLTEEGLPHALRSIGTLPVVYIIATIPLLWIFQRIEKYNFSVRKMFLSLLIIALLSVGIFNALKYFVFFADNPNQHGAFAENYKNMAKYALLLKPETNTYVIANGQGQNMEDGLPVSAQVIKYLTNGKNQNLTYVKRGEKIKIEKPAVIIFMNSDSQLIADIKKDYPQAEVQIVDINPGYGSDFTSMVIN